MASKFNSLDGLIVVYNPVVVQDLIDDQQSNDEAYITILGSKICNFDESQLKINDKGFN